MTHGWKRDTARRQAWHARATAIAGALALVLAAMPSARAADKGLWAV